MTVVGCVVLLWDKREIKVDTQNLCMVQNFISIMQHIFMLVLKYYATKIADLIFMQSSVFTKLYCDESNQVLFDMNSSGNHFFHVYICDMISHECFIQV